MTVKHAPTKPVRSDVIGEVIFMRRWHGIVTTNVLNKRWQIVPFLIDVLEPVSPCRRKDVTEREAMVAASFVKWFGTSCGNCFLGELYRAQKAAPLLGEIDACAKFWASENAIQHRKGYRLIQAILAKQEDFQSGGLARVSYTAHDVNVIECVTMWLGSPRGVAFAKQCNDEIKQYWKADFVKLQKRLGISNVPA